MRKVLLNSLFVSPAVLGAALMMSSAAIAAEKQVNQASLLSTSAIEVTGQSLDASVLKADTQLSFEKPSASVVEPTKTLDKLAANNIDEVAQAPSGNAEAAQIPSKEVKVAQVAPEVEAAPASSAPSVDSLDQINRYSREGKSAGASAGQVTSVSQLSDVRPTDWAFQALQSLVERYGCIAGYPDRTYRGNRALTRYEFAAGLNACLDRVNELIAASTADLVKKEDLATLQKLQEEFAAELATLRGRVDALEARTTTLERQQFSTTTKLAGEAVFAVTDEFGVDGTGGNNTVFQNRVRLSLNTSFTGQDLLVTRLAAGNAQTFALSGAGTPGGTAAEGFQTFNFGNTGGNQTFIDWVAYYFPLNDRVKFYIPAFAGLHYDYVPTANPAFDSGDSGSTTLSYFGQRNPIYAIGGGSGIGVNFRLSDAFQISAGYLADNSTDTAALGGASNPASKAGLFNGSYSALGQLTFNAGEALQVGLTYVNAYRRGAIFDGGGGSPVVGTLLANRSTTALGANASSQVSAYGAEVAFRLSPGLVLNGFASLINANFVDDGVGQRDIWTYGVGLALPDFGKRGNLLGFIAGAEPYLGNPSGAQRAAGVRNDIPLHFEGFYKYQLNDNISITPGVIWIVNPGQNDNNDDVVIGTLRTTFTF
ncbi:iron uptake porin [Myxacorys almedinensis]|uniref:Iron uptake porin n=1 Tax=Myxacorys almedinensis A TaxID=2690445 RepID=A0A8J8CIR7_9CYAN|nr:iron uptake porin [Myxacorys almedinensis]NDJ16821.1 iron uptake porin [Myxacorys almedinensis A]